MEFKINESILITIFIIFIFIFYKVKRNRLTLVEANDNVKYMVYNDRNKDSSANKLSELIKRMFELKNYLVNNINNFPEYKEYIILLRDNFDEKKTSIYENAPDSDLTSLKKAKLIKTRPPEIALPDTDEYFDENDYDSDEETEFLIQPREYPGGKNKSKKIKRKNKTKKRNSKNKTRNLR